MHDGTQDLKIAGTAPLSAMKSSTGSADINRNGVTGFVLPTIRELSNVGGPALATTCEAPSCGSGSS